MSSSYTVHVSGLAPETTDTKLSDFFSFCGKLTSVKKNGTEADITFEKQSAMRTALMLNGGTLDGAHLTVTSASPEANTDKASTPPPADSEPTIAQEDKPKGISSRFLNFVNNIDKKAGERLVGEGHTVSQKLREDAATAYAKAEQVDKDKGVSERFHQYYTKALGTPLGQKVANFYTQTQKQLLDVHDEAKRIAQEKKAASGAATPAHVEGSETAPAATSASTGATEKADTAAAAPATEKSA
ncbi:hypothetical protein A1Q2_08117 [Trichosporon asahii var. asahii CBS 8904]|uniref:RRM domain-containing protein n=1 Tax=Trichosporon asahii var. asahii (strain CBS 8904) TaxID=1220162 RepID=K1V0Y8_TRIAC|nr:hypothetical protein A1Q2_08117 [Trichosporon asahii var. asahii CBS 8904]